MDKSALLRKMARRASVGVSEKIPLTYRDPNTGDVVDVSEGCTYYVQFRDVGGTAKDAVLAATIQETVEREQTRRGQDSLAIKESVKRQAAFTPIVTAIVENNLVANACFPVLNAGGVVQPWKWRAEDNEENLAFLLDERTPYALLVWFVEAAQNFLLEAEEVVEELGESSESTESE